MRFIPDDEGYQRCYVSQGEAMILAPEDRRPWVYHRCVYGLVGDGDEVPFWQSAQGRTWDWRDGCWRHA